MTIVIKTIRSVRKERNWIEKFYQAQYSYNISSRSKIQFACNDRPDLFWVAEQSHRNYKSPNKLWWCRRIKRGGWKILLGCPKRMLLFPTEMRLNLMLKYYFIDYLKTAEKILNRNSLQSVIHRRAFKINLKYFLKISAFVELKKSLYKNVNIPNLINVNIFYNFLSLIGDELYRYFHKFTRAF